MKRSLSTLLREALMVTLSLSLVMATCPLTAQARQFSDVPKGHWAYSVIQRATNLKLMKGYKSGKFGPGDSVTRGQVAIVLWNMAGQPKAGSKAKSFSDVKKGSYCYSAVRWASSKGIVAGYGGGKFGPGDRVTREQLATMLASYAKKKAGRDTSVGAFLYHAPMLDSGKVSSWARESVSWCFQKGIMGGSKGKINPKGNATRAEAAKMFVYLYDELHGESHATEIYLPKAYCGTYSIHNVAGPIPEDVGGRNYPEGTVLEERTLVIDSIGENYVVFTYYYMDTMNMAHGITIGECAGVMEANGMLQFTYVGTNDHATGSPSGESGWGYLRFAGGKVYVMIYAEGTAHGFSCSTDGELAMTKGVKEVIV